MKRTRHPVGMLLLLQLALAACGAAVPQSGVEQVRLARFAIVDSDAPPPDSAFTETVTLPDFWNLRRPDASGIGWYRIPLQLPPTEGETWAVYLPSSSSSLAVYLAGERLGPARLGGEPNLQNWNRPEYFELPDHLLGNAPGSFDVRLWAREGNFRGLAPVEIGPARLLQPRYRAARLRLVDISVLWLVLGVAQVVFATALWVATDRGPLYACFGWVALAWLVPAGVQMLPRFPGSFWLGQWLVQAGIDQMAVAAVFVAHRIVGVSRPRLERGVFLAGMLSAAALGATAAFETRLFDRLAIGFHAIALLAAVYLPVLFVRARARLTTAERAILITCVGAVLLAGAHDLAAQAGWESHGHQRLVLHILPLLLLCFFAVLIVRFLAAHRRADRQNVELEATIAAKTAELEQQYAQTAQLRRDSVLAGERARMMREMHDGMGAHLVTLLSAVENAAADREALAVGLRDLIDELRLVIHSLEPEGREVGLLLGLIRRQITSRTGRAGLRIDWRVAAVEDSPELTPEASLHLVRIVQEAIANVLKHAGARTVVIAMEGRERAGSAGVVVRIEDDGIGLGPSSDVYENGGRGIRNMKQRAVSLAGELRVLGTGSGAAVELWLPLGPSSPATRGG